MIRGLFKPHKTIGVNYLERWHLVPRNRWFNVYLHKFSGSDDDRALHDHPWPSFSILLKGMLVEHRRLGVTTDGKLEQSQYGTPVHYWVRRFMIRGANYAHRLELHSEHAWTLFITGPRIREWGFHCPGGWKPWHTMSTSNGQMTGGCE